MYRVIQKSDAPLRSGDTNLIRIAGMGRMIHVALVLLKLTTAPIDVNSVVSSSELSPLVVLHLYLASVVHQNR